MASNVQIVDLRGGGRLPPPPPVAFDPGVVGDVREILAEVRTRGDAALDELTRRFDGADLSSGIAVDPEGVDGAAAAVPREVREAIASMIERLRDLHARQLPQEWWAERDGQLFGEIVRPLRRVGCYVPGGRAAYPSTVAMTVVPASVAGVEEIVVTTPPRPDGSVPEAVLYTAARAGASLVVRVGGAQAVAALAYGTETVPAVDKIVGPGNVYVTAAKREVSGTVGIDSLAGPTELVVVTDGSADPRFLAADLLAQAEHDPLARATLLLTRDAGPDGVLRALEGEVAASPRRAIVEAALRHAMVVLVRDEAQAADVANELAPEHLQVLLPDPRRFLERVRSAGAVFLGPWTPVPFGDYGVGSNHVLPTMRTARFSSGLRSSDFVKVSSVVEVWPSAAARLAREIAGVARIEGLDGHARAVEVRAERAATEKVP